MRVLIVALAILFGSVTQLWAPIRVIVFVHGMQFNGPNMDVDFEVQCLNGIKQRTTRSVVAANVTAAQVAPAIKNLIVTFVANSVECAKASIVVDDIVFFGIPG